MYHDQQKEAEHPYPEKVLTLKPDTVLTYEAAAVVVTEMIANAIPGPHFFRKWLDQKRTRKFNLRPEAAVEEFGRWTLKEWSR